MHLTFGAYARKENNPNFKVGETLLDVVVYWSDVDT